VKGTDVAISFQEVARRYTSQLDSLDGIQAPMSFPGGAHVAEVEIDPDTGVIDILNYVAVDDCGRVINHVLLEGQTFGAIVQGVGQVSCAHASLEISVRTPGAKGSQAVIFSKSRRLTIASSSRLFSKSQHVRNLIFKSLARRLR